ncbi:MAG: hypothetical protein GWP27_03535 [Bacteroidetes bacterium]|nr:hypothetical protein [Bacteroidota bacterium]
MKRRYISLLCSSSLLVMISSCGGETESNSQEADADSTVAEVETQSLGFDAQGGSSYAVPSPNELFSIIKDSHLPYVDGLVSTEQPNYETSKEQALNFGRLTADIAYTASYEKFQESITNCDNLRKIGNDLGISYVFDELLVNRFKSNMDNADSLEVISSGTYQSIIAQLEENEKGSTLAIIAAGGFVESIYLLTTLIGEYQDDDEIIQRLADQKLVMENVLDYLNLYAEEDRVIEVLEEVRGVSETFLNLEEEEVSESVDTEGGKVVLGGSRVIMTEAEFNTLKEAAASYRNNFANATKS